METLKQELPPPGGFHSVQYDRVPLKKYWPASLKWFGLLGVMTAGWYGYYLDKKRLRYEGIEQQSAKCALMPLLVAESDRLKLKMYRKLREEETNLMKDNPDWKVGTYKGEPIYKTLKPDEWYEPNFLCDLYAHVPYEDFSYPYFYKFSH